MKEKAKAIGWSALYAGIVFAAMLAVSFVMGFVAAVTGIKYGILSVDSFSDTQFENFISQIMSYFMQGDAMMILNTSIQFVLFACFGTWYYLREKKFQYRPDYRRSFRIRNVVDIILIGFLGQYALNLVMLATFFLLPSQVDVYTELMKSLDIDAANPLLMVFSVGFFGPLVEELVFRGMIFGRLRRAFMFWPSAVISAALFGIYHMNIVQGIYAGVFGLVLAYVFEKTESIWGCYILHAAFNCSSYLISWYEGALEDHGIVAPDLVMILIGAVAAVLVVVLMRRLGRRLDVRQSVAVSEAAVPGEEG